MSGIDGFEVCRRIKSDPATCHLPVILLTAYSLPEQQIQGINAGADAYVIKPFSPDYLLALIKTTLNNRLRIRQMLTSATRITTEEKPRLISMKFWIFSPSAVQNSTIRLKTLQG